MFFEHYSYIVAMELQDFSYEETIAWLRLLLLITNNLHVH
jgi:hypothetical protein